MPETTKFYFLPSTKGLVTVHRKGDNDAVRWYAHWTHDFASSHPLGFPQMTAEAVIEWLSSWDAKIVPLASLGDYPLYVTSKEVRDISVKPDPGRGTIVPVKASEVIAHIGATTRDARTVLEYLKQHGVRPPIKPRPSATPKPAPVA